MKEIVVTCNVDTVDEVSKELEAKGAKIQTVLKIVNIIICSWGGEFEELKNIPGVLAVEKSETNYTQSQ